MRIGRALGERCPLLHINRVPVGIGFGIEPFAETVRNQITSLLGVLVVGDDNMLVLFDFTERKFTVDFGKNGKRLGLSCLKQFFNTRQTLCDILTRCDTAGMEGTHRQLCTGFTDGLCGDNADRFADGDRLAGSQVRAVALNADAVLGFASKQRTNLDAAVVRIFAGIDHIRNFFSGIFGHHFVFGVNQLAGGLINEILQQITAGQALFQGLNHFLTVGDVVNLNAVVAVAILFANNHILRNIDQTSGQVTGVRSTKGGIRQAFPRTARRNEVFENIQAFAVVCTNRNFNRFTCRVRDKSAHTGKLTQLAFRTTRAGIDHHINRVLFAEVVFQALRNFIGAFFPNLDNGFGAFGVAHQAHFVVGCNRIDAFLCLFKQFALLRRNGRIANRDGNTALGGILVALRLNFVKHFGGDGYAVYLNALVNNLPERLFVDEEIHL